MNNLPTVPCRVCTQPTTATAIKICHPCWNVDSNLEGFLLHEEGRRIVRAALAGHIEPAPPLQSYTLGLERGGLMEEPEWSVTDVHTVEAANLRAAKDKWIKLTDLPDQERQWDPQSQTYYAWRVVECAPVGRAHVALRPYQAEALRARSRVHVHDSITLVHPTAAEMASMVASMRAALEKCEDVADRWPDDPHVEQRHATQGIVGEALAPAPVGAAAYFAALPEPAKPFTFRPKPADYDMGQWPPAGAAAGVCGQCGETGVVIGGTYPHAECPHGHKFRIHIHPRPGFWRVRMEDGTEDIVRLADGGKIYVHASEHPCPPSRVEEFVEYLGDEKGRV